MLVVVQAHSLDYPYWQLHESIFKIFYILRFFQIPYIIYIDETKLLSSTMILNRVVLFSTYFLKNSHAYEIESLTGFVTIVICNRQLSSKIQEQSEHTIIGGATDQIPMTKLQMISGNTTRELPRQYFQQNPVNIYQLFHVVSVYFSSFIIII